MAVSISRSGCTTTAVRPAARADARGRGFRGGPRSRRRWTGQCCLHAPIRAEALAFERAGDQRFDRRSEIEQRVDGHHRRGCACRAAAETARERQALANAERDATPLARAIQQGLRSDAGGVPSRLARQTPGVSGDVVDGDAGRGCPRGHFVAWRGQRKAEHVEATGDVRHRRRRESGHCIHGSTILSDGLRVAGYGLRTPGCGSEVQGSGSRAFH